MRAWALTLVVMACTVASALLLAGAGSGVIRASLSTPGGVLTWLSPTTAIGKPLGIVLTAFGWTEDPASALGVVRLIGLVLAAAAIAYLVLRPGGRSPVRGAAIALAAIVLLGPVVQPWYLLWFLPLFAATGLTGRELRVAVVLTGAFTVHGMIESSTNADNLTDISDSITFLVAVVIVALILLTSPRERLLALGPTGVDGLLPMTPDEEERAAAMRWPARERVHA